MVRSSSLPLVFIPGHMGTALDWQYQRAAFGERELIIPATHYRLNSIAAMAADIAAQLPQRFDLVGWSMGGYIVFELLRIVMDRVRNLVLLHTSARAESIEAAGRRQDLLHRVEMQGMAAVYATEIPRLMACPEALDNEFLELLLAERLRLGKDALVAQIAALTTRRDARAYLPEINCTTLVIAGERDVVTPPLHAQELAAAIPRSRLHVFADTGHCSPWERPTQLNDLLRTHLN